MFDMDDAELPRGTDLIPDGSFDPVTMRLRRGGHDGHAEIDRGLLKPTKTPDSDVLMLDCEFTVVAGPLARHKFWQTFSVVGGKVDEHGVSIAWKISKGIIRTMIDSACGLDPQDMSEVARAKRVLRGLADLDGITFAAKIKVEAANDPRYGDSNRLDRVVLPNEPDHRRIMAGEAVPAVPSQRTARPAAPVANNTAPAWGAPPQQALPVAATPSWQRQAPAAAPSAPATPPTPAAALAFDGPILAEQLRRPMSWIATGGRVTAGKGASRAPCHRPIPVHRASPMRSGCSARSAAARHAASESCVTEPGPITAAPASAQCGALTSAAHGSGGRAA